MNWPDDTSLFLILLAIALCVAMVLGSLAGKRR